MEATTDEVWYVLLQGEELGPLSFEDVLDFYYKDLVSSESMLWREGWSTWVQIVQVPEFNELLFKGMIAPAEPLLENGIHEDTAFIDPSALSQVRHSIKPSHDFVEEELEELIEFDELDPLEGDEDEQPSLLLDDPTPAPAYVHSQVRIPPQSQKRSSMPVFLLLSALVGVGGWYVHHEGWFPSGQELEQRQTTPPQKPEVLVVIPEVSAPSSDSALITATSLASETENLPSGEQAGVQNLPEGVIEITPSETEETPKPSPEEVEDFTQQKTTSTLSAGVTEITPQDDQGGASTSSSQGASEEEVVGGEIEIDTPVVIGLPQPSLTSADQKDSDKEKRGKRSTTGIRKKPAQPVKQPLKKPPQAPQSEKKPESEVPMTLSRAQLEGVLNRSQSELSACASQDDQLKGSANVSVVIQRNGVVSEVKPTSYKLRKSAAVTCVLGVIKKLKFPAYGGDLLKVNLPISF